MEDRFYSACIKGDIDALKRMLSPKERIDVTAWSEEAFQEVCGLGYKSIVELLLSLDGDRRIDVHAGGERAFRNACGDGHMGIVKLLLSLDGDRCIDVRAWSGMALQAACENGHMGIVELLLSLDGDRRIDVHTLGAAGLPIACQRGHTGIVKLLLSLDGDRRIDVHHWLRDNGFMNACLHGQDGTLELLLSLDGDRRIDVHADGERAFRKACERGHTGIVKLLLSLDGDRRIDVHALGEAAFQEACRRGFTDVVELLLSLDGDRRIDMRDWGNRAFRSVCRLGHYDIVKMLLSLDGDRRIDMHDLRESALWYACISDLGGGCVRVVRLLLSLPPQAGGFTWETPAQQALLVRCIVGALRSCGHAAAAVLLQHTPLPPSFLRQLTTDGRVPSPLPDLEPCEVAVVQQVLLLLSRQHSRSAHGPSQRLGAGDRFSSLPGDRYILPLCCILMPAHSAAVAAVLCSAVPDRAQDLQPYLAGLVWWGVRVPLVHAPGVHLLAAQAGGLGRVGRRGLLLHRAAARGARAEERARLKAARLGGLDK